MNDTLTIPVKTFKEVHEELEQESIFLQKNHNIDDFNFKAEFLKTIGFTNSIATKLYSGIVNSSNHIEHYNENYKGIYKFIIPAQLERICEKYNLYIRNLNFFLGDIPEKNIKDIINFSIDINDLDINDYYIEQITNNFRFRWSNTKIDLATLFETYSKLKINISSNLQIAAVENLFSSEAFKHSKERIINNAEIAPKFTVNLDPIVLFKVKHGYLIITAWGDEANDELVVNTNLN